VDSPALAAAERAAWAAAPAPLRGLIVDCLALAPEKRPSAQQLLDTPLLVAERAEAERELAVEEAVAPLKAEIRTLKSETSVLKEELRTNSEEVERLSQQVRDHQCPDHAPLLAENAALKARLAELEAKNGGGGGAGGGGAAVGGGGGDGSTPTMVKRYAGGPLKARCVAKLAHKSGVLSGVNALAVVAELGLVSGNEEFICAWAQGADRGLKSIVGSAWRIAALPGGRFATTGSSIVEVWDAGTMRLLQNLCDHTRGDNCVAALPGFDDGRLLASGRRDKTVRIWNATAGALVATLEGHTGEVNALAALPDGRLASGSNDATVRLWNVATRVCTQVLQRLGQVYALAVLDGSRLASGGQDDRINIWSLADGVEEAVLEGHTVFSLAALSNGLLASGGNDCTVRVWDVGARACVAVLEGHRGHVGALAALPDGRLASGSRGDPLIHVWALTAPGSPEDAAAAAAAACCVTVAAAP
jgi:hypothetical protein